MVTDSAALPSVANFFNQNRKPTMRTLCLSSAVTAAPPAPSRPRRRWRTAALLLGLAAFCADASAAIFGPAGVQPAYYPSTSAQATEAVDD